VTWDETLGGFQGETGLSDETLGLGGFQGETGVFDETLGGFQCETDV